MPTTLDHIVIGAATLSQGKHYVRDQLGIDIPSGGCHTKMGTHNCLTKLGESTFLEVIAIDEKGEPPMRPRWFGLDDRWVQERLKKRPQLLTWVVNCDDIKVVLQQSQVSFGTAEEINRGELSWYFGVPDDGRLLASGILPYIMSWQTPGHPAESMKDLGCQLVRLRLFTPFVDWTTKVLSQIKADLLVEIHDLPANSSPYLEAEIATPSGLKILRN